MSLLENKMFEIQRYIPFTAHRYSADQYGNIYQGGVKLKQQIINNTLMAELDWVNGRDLYLVAVIVLVCFGKLKLPDHLYSIVEPLYIDGDWRNVRPANLIYRYKNSPIEVEEHPGYFYIPLYNDYAINLAGELINISTGKIKSWSVTKQGGPKNQTGGYSYSRVLNDHGFSKTLFLHRALCMVFKPYDHTLLSIVVNHKDGNPSNNALGNLEWVTYRQNNIHAVEIGMRPNSADPILMRNLKTGEELRFPSTIACARHLGHDRDNFIYRRLQHNPIKIFEDMLIFKHDNGQPWPVIDLENIDICRVSSDIIARNVFTGEKILFSGSIKGEVFTGVKAATILTHVRDNKVIPINGWNFRYAENATLWPGHTDRHLKVYEKYPIYPPDGVTMTNKDTGEEKFYESAADAANDNRLSTHLLRDYVTKEILFKNKYILKYFKLRENLGPAVA